jgi:glycerophosphoryl diester phosphodiesterase
VTHPWFASPRPRILAHRGFVPADAEGIVENSVAAVAAAHAAGAVYVESDCHLTADGVVVLFHDDDLARVTGDPRRVDAVPLRELEEIMATRGGLLTLSQALETFPDVLFNLDVKSDAVAVPVGHAVAADAHRVLIASFSDRRRREALAAARAAGGVPAASAGTGTVVRVVAAVALRSRRLLRRAVREIDALQVPERRGPLRIVTRRLIESLHREGVEVHVWTVNETTHMRRLLDLGVDGLVTDRVDIGLRTAS